MGQADNSPNIAAQQLSEASRPEPMLLSPDERRAMLTQAQQLAAKGDDLTGIRVLEEMAKRPPLDEEFIFHVSQIYQKLGYLLDALNLTQWARERIPSINLTLLALELLEQLQQSIRNVSFRDSAAILMIAQECSASIYIQQELAHRLKMPRFTPDLVDPYVPYAYLDLTRLQQLILEGGVGRAHVFPHDETIFALHCSLMPKLWVHFRDPRQSLLSIAHNLDKAYQCTNPERPIGFTLPMLMYYLPVDYFSRDLSGKLDFLIDWKFPLIIEFIHRWLAASKKDIWNFKMKITTCEQFHADYDGFFADILSFLEIDSSRWVGEKHVCTPETGCCMFRKGVDDEWRTVFTSTQKEQMLAAIPPGLLEECGWTP